MLRSARRDDTPMQYQRAPVLPPGALKDWISTPAVDSSPERRPVRQRVSEYCVVTKRVQNVVFSFVVMPICMETCKDASVMRQMSLIYL